MALSIKAWVFVWFGFFVSVLIKNGNVYTRLTTPINFNQYMKQRPHVVKITLKIP